MKDQYISEKTIPMVVSEIAKDHIENGPFPQESSLAQRRVRYVKDTLALGGKIAGLFVAYWLMRGVVHGPRKFYLRWYERKRDRGETIYVEDLPGAKKLKPEEMRDPQQEALARAPRPSRHPFKARHLRIPAYPPAKDTYAYRTPPKSGKVLAGVGEKVRRRTTKFFHSTYAKPFGAMNYAFHLMARLEAVDHVLWTIWQNRHAEGPVAPTRKPVADPEAMAEHLKEKAKEFGCPLVGITPVVEDALYAHAKDHLPYAIVFAAPMERETMLTVPSIESGAAITEGYNTVGNPTLALARYIRRLGWNAVADTNHGAFPSLTMHVPLAVNAGLGQMGRHTSLITKEFGANVRLAAVLTDIPVTFDGQKDIGVEDLCANCTICLQNCPANAIYEDKVWVRGVEKYHLDFDRCMPYFVANETCGICITVCPWSDTDKGPLISLLQQQRRQVQETYPEPLPVAELALQIDENAQLGPPMSDADPEDLWRDAVISEKIEHPGNIVELTLSAPEGQNALPPWAAGAHVELYLPSGKVRAYTLSNAPQDGPDYRLSVKVEENGTGGSKEIGTLREGQTIRVNRPGNNFPIRHSDDYAYLMSGGIGVTPMISVAADLKAAGIPFEIHYSVKDSIQAVHADELRALSGGKLHVHTNRDWMKDIFAEAPARSGVYTCGPLAYMNAVRQTAIERGISKDAIYSEDFGSDAPDNPFDVVLGSTGQRFTVEPGETIARALQRRGIYVPVSCGYGICGTCTLGVLEGEPDARDQVFTDEERKTKITTCCSRSHSSEIVVDL
ncbi:2Fe-2S iron-sulfur cluster-binding protein [Thalassococcus sp. S3]|uniref:2Fe-2S iron-sulfur cluster-binding protein n=1 Tax=Thalassococcus sp. S3 TaxID=2017482 RepID=UPI00102421CF|nr:reductive dehalogenase domain-containing protein [Thalassococcus sp. S3]QBF33371.1 hypothetical protein CFI11_19435 [Thalassococcus sp. S3]